MDFLDPHYFDYAASSIPFVESLEVQREASEKYWANPSSQHSRGKEAKRFITKQKGIICDLCSFKEGRLLLFSSATEANNFVMHHALSQGSKKILLASDAHASLSSFVDANKGRIELLPLTSKGELSYSFLENSQRDEYDIVLVSHIGHELGIVHDIQRVAQLCRQKGIALHIDGAQALGHLNLNLDAINWGSYAFAAHKFSGPRGLGGLFFREEDYSSCIIGGQQEYGLRAGTENCAALAGTSSALERSLSSLLDEQERKKKWEVTLKNECSHLSNLNFEEAPGHLPGFLSLGCKSFLASEQVEKLAVFGFSLSSGSACHEGALNPSKTILAMGKDEQEALSHIRISMGWGNSDESVLALAQAFKKTMGTVS
ncbi:MAG: aminotransferase class V-fold PLP-dependent enzyme [Planctomycetes bacterium]|nr:aminotransferase class V-fold PLP-dependent enzyme [Planctomycetota bacterium]